MDAATNTSKELVMARLQLMFKERRIADRRQLTGLFPGKLLRAVDQREVMGKPVDVSRSGLGVLSAEQMDPGTELFLEIQGQRIALQIAWGQKDFGKRDLFRYGLVTVNPDDNLELLFLRTGCLK
jgi:hypothetical protein